MFHSTSVEGFFVSFFLFPCFTECAPHCSKLTLLEILNTVSYRAQMSGNYDLVYLKVVGIFTKLLFSVFLTPISFCITPKSFL